MSRDIYIAIMVADAKGVGLHLSADEVAQLTLDEAIRAAALNMLEPSDWPEHRNHGEPDWSKIDPARKRTAANMMAIAPESVRR